MIFCVAHRIIVINKRNWKSVCIMCAVCALQIELIGWIDRAESPGDNKTELWCEQNNDEHSFVELLLLLLCLYVLLLSPVSFIAAISYKYISFICRFHFVISKCSFCVRSRCVCVCDFSPAEIYRSHYIIYSCMSIYA